MNDILIRNHNTRRSKRVLCQIKDAMEGLEKIAVLCMQQQQNKYNIVTYQSVTQNSKLNGRQNNAKHQSKVESVGLPYIFFAGAIIDDATGEHWSIETLLIKRPETIDNWFKSLANESRGFSQDIRDTKRTTTIYFILSKEQEPKEQSQSCYIWKNCGRLLPSPTYKIQ